MEKTINDLKEASNKLHEAINALHEATLMTYDLSDNDDLSYEDSNFLKRQAKSMQKLNDQLIGQQIEIIQFTKTHLSQD